MPRKPKNGLVVGGVDLFDRFGLALLDDWTVGTPAPKVYQVDIPGGDGCIDVTESLSGDTAYSNRQMSFEFLYVGDGFEAAKTEVANFLHGRSFDFSLTWDPGYTYTGRFSIDEWYSRMHHGRVLVSVDAQPYKLREHKTVRAAAAAGAMVTLECGRKRQCPRVSCDSEFEVAFDGETVRVQAGTWTLPDLWLREGDNEVFVLSDLSGGDLTLGEWASSTLASLAGSRLSDLMWSYDPPDDEDRAVYFEYDVMDI